MRCLLIVLLLLAVPACAPRQAPETPPRASTLEVEVPDSILARFTQRDLQQRPFDSLQVLRSRHQFDRRERDPRIEPDLGPFAMPPVVLRAAGGRVPIIDRPTAVESGPSVCLARARRG